MRTRNILGKPRSMTTSGYADCDNLLTRRLVSVGQVSLDTIVKLDRPLSLYDQNRGSFSWSLGGTAAIVAHNAATLGCAPIFVGHLGSGSERDAAADSLLRAGVAIGATTDSAPSLRISIIVDPSGQRTMLSNCASPDWSTLEVSFMPDDVVFFEGWHLFDVPGRASYIRLIEQAASAGATVVLDVCSASRALNQNHHADLLAALPLDIVLANEGEAAAFPC